MRRFIDNAGTPCAVMLISSDVNFSVDLSDFKNRKKIHVILLHGHLASEALILSSNEHYLFDDLVDHVTTTPQFKVAVHNSFIFITISHYGMNYFLGHSEDVCLFRSDEFAVKRCRGTRPPAFGADSGELRRQSGGTA